MRFLKILSTAVLLAGFSSAQAASVVVNSSNMLIGATGVVVQDRGTYDVSFMSGTCLYIFDGCDSVADFTFQSVQSAIAASQALLDQVLLDLSALWSFDSNPNQTLGCAVNYCEVHTPYALSSSGSDVIIRYAQNNSGTQADGVSMDINAIDLMSINSYGPYARWTLTSGPSLTATPIPAALPLFLTGIAAIGWFRRRKTQVANAA